VGSEGKGKRKRHADQDQDGADEAACAQREALGEEADGKEGHPDLPEVGRHRDRKDRV